MEKLNFKVMVIFLNLKLDKPLLLHFYAQFINPLTRKPVVTNLQMWASA